MGNNVTLTDDDEGKRVVNNSGDEVGRVIEVQQGTAYVEPDAGLTDTIESKLGWGDSNEHSYQLNANSIERISDNEIHLNQ